MYHRSFFRHRMLLSVFSPVLTVLPRALTLEKNIRLKASWNRIQVAKILPWTAHFAALCECLLKNCIPAESSIF